MRLSLLPRLVTILLLAVAAFATVNDARAQRPQIIGDTGREDLTGGEKRRSQPRVTKRPETRYANESRVVKVASARRPPQTRTTVSLSVSTQPNAVVVIESVTGVVAKEGTVPAGESIFVFSGLKPGTYRVAAALDGYDTEEREVEIVANRPPKGVSLSLKPTLYTVKINTENINTGEVRYAPVEQYTDTPTGEKKFKPTGETRLAFIQNGSAEFRAQRGTYGVDIRATDDVGYETLLGTVTVPDDPNKNVVELKVRLKNNLSTKTFSGLANEEWELPNANWRIASSLLSVRGPGVALPRSPEHRYYTDFHLESDVRMVKGVAASFALRAQDKQNYYLIQLTGADAEERFQLVGYVVKNGVRQARLGSRLIAAFATTIKPNQFFKVQIRMKGIDVDVSIEDSQTGEFLPLGGLSDSYKNFPIGAAGIAAIFDDEQTDVGSFIVCPSECKTQ